MKILIVSWFFPPANTIGAVRLGNLAGYLEKQGHDMSVGALIRLAHEEDASDGAVLVVDEGEQPRDER